MSKPKELAKAYDASLVEDQIYDKWLESGHFKGKIVAGKQPFVIMMPPPNATGTLHLGHATMLAIEDLLVRYHRMKGDPTLWLPGTDHAAIATQTKVEKIIAEQGMTRQKLGREMFLERVHKFVGESQATIRKQVRKMGSSCDWSRERYTLDEGLTAAVQNIFVQMYQDGLIYRGHRIVNWCKRCSSTLADDEVVYEPAKAKLYYIKYGPFTVATVRPETKFGDTALAVNPNDERYKKYIGKTVRVKDVLGESDIKVIGDKDVDQDFGSGVVKVTPAHDAVDFAMSQRHGLEVRQVIDETGKLNQKAGKYAGMTAEEARPKVVEDLKELGLLEKVEEYQHNIALCYRCSTIIDPLVSLQWFVDVDKGVLASTENGTGGPGKKLSLKEKAVQVVKSGEIKIIPDRFNKVYYHWMENLHDWCISRQIWFGHRIPVWYCLDCYQPSEARMKGDKKSAAKGLVVSVDQPTACEDCKGTKFVQDPDTLDTWFSSGLWTFSTLGWSQPTEDLKYFHPTSVLETGYDILFFWVARMILMTNYALKTVPFKTVYLHGMVRDDKGRKMSKSLGNIIDPLDMIAKFGTDPVRLSLLIGTGPANDLKMSEEKISGFRNFVNKVWNVSRFILMSAEPDKKVLEASIKPKAETLADRYILSRLHKLIESTTTKIEKFEFSGAGEELFHFTWNELADWYLEVSKFEKGSDEAMANKSAILIHILTNLLKLWHPYTPFVTEEIWKRLNPPEMLIISQWPEAGKKYADPKAEKEFGLIKEVITSVRNLRQSKKIPPSSKIPVTIYAGSHQKLLAANQHMLTQLGRISELTLQEKGAKVSNSVSGVVEDVQIYIPLDQAIDME
ncbi:valine--tRNA ligase, partial [Candidatus Uhrbacteria bacterium]|nr:valine--tRNA ligase [Candidatus Uhrbacteria bacterium]